MVSYVQATPTMPPLSSQSSGLGTWQDSRLTRRTDSGVLQVGNVVILKVFFLELGTSPTPQGKQGTGAMWLYSRG